MQQIEKSITKFQIVTHHRQTVDLNYISAKQASVLHSQTHVLPDACRHDDDGTHEQNHIEADSFFHIDRESSMESRGRPVLN